ncbi:MAG: SDR family oxidoreductase, partial [Myxococcota bacterium]
MASVMIQGASRGIGLEFCKQLSERGTRVVATARAPERSSELQELAKRQKHISIEKVDLLDESTLEKAAERLAARGESLRWIINVAGLLHGHGVVPEKKLSQIDPEQLVSAFRINTVGPALVAKHFASFMQGSPAVFASLSARVGSISDNRLGGWYGYRCSKAAQNMLTKNLSIELKRRIKDACVVALHPGTVDTDLSRPYQRSAKVVFSTQKAVQSLLKVLDG